MSNFRQPHQEQITKFGISAMILHLLFVLCLMAILPSLFYLIYSYKDIIFNLHFSSIYNQLLNYHEYLVWFIVAYLFFLIAMRFTKWFTRSEEDQDNKYLQSFLVIYWILINFILVPYEIFLAINTFTNFPLLEWIIFGIFFYCSVTIEMVYFYKPVLLNLSSEIQKLLIKIIPFLVFLYIGLSILAVVIWIKFDYKYLELFLLIFITWLLKQLFLFVSKQYLATRENYNLLYPFFKKITGRDPSFKINFKEWFDNIDNILVWIITFLKENTGYSIFLLFLSIWIIPLWIYLKFNLISILLLHLSLVFDYYFLCVMANKLPSLVNLQCNWKKYKEVFLLQSTEKKVIFLTKNARYICSPDKIDFIEIINNKK